MPEDPQTCGGGCASCSKGGAADPANRDAPNGMSLVWRCFVAFIVPPLVAVAGGIVLRCYRESLVPLGFLGGLILGVLIARMIFVVTRRTPRCHLGDSKSPSCPSQSNSCRDETCP